MQEIEKLNKENLPICKRCNRKLKNPIAIERGYGIVCWEKELREQHQKPLFEINSPMKN